MLVLAEDATPTKSALRRDRVAPWQHTAFIVLILALWAVYGALRSKSGAMPDTPRWLRYSGQIMALSLMTGTTIAGLYHRRRFIRMLVGRIEWTRDAWAGLLVFFGGTALIVIVGLALRPLQFLHLTHTRDVVIALSPHTGFELALWVLVSASAGVCEEFIFRGYLLRQVLHWSGSSVVAVAITAILFGSMHLYEGTAAAIQITALGAWLGAVAVRRNSLRQVAIAHFLQDAIAGLALFLHH